MIPKLFPASATSWDTEGSGRLTGALRCDVKEKLNGEYTMQMEYPMDGELRTSIIAGSQIVTTPSYGHTPEPFDVKSINVASSSGKLTVKGQHISYRLNKYTVMPYTASSAALAMSGLISNAAQTCPFTMFTDKSTSASYKQIVPASIRSRLGGVAGSILDVYGGEYEFTRMRVNLWSKRGTDRGVEIRYGKNLVDANQERSIANTITGICPFWSKEVDGSIQTVVLPEKVLTASTAANYPYPLTKAVDLTGEFEDKPTVAQLRTRAQKYLTDNVTGIPTVNLKVSFVNLHDTEDYANIAPLERVELGDTVRVYFEELGINATARVIETDWDALRERYNSITLGDAKNTITDRIVSNSNDIAALSNSVQNDLAGQYSQLKAAIDTATAAITGQSGGHVYFGLGADGKPNEIYIMDTDSVSTASKVWRYNLAGWGVSTNGIGGPYTMAATLESGLVADFITAGTINANLVRIINLIVDHLRSYNSNSTVMLESESGYLDIRSYDSTDQKWRQRVGIYRNSTADIGQIRVSSGDVNENGEPEGTSSRTIISPTAVAIGMDADGNPQGNLNAGYINAKTIGVALATNNLTTANSTWSFSINGMRTIVIQGRTARVEDQTAVIPTATILTADTLYGWTDETGTTQFAIRRSGSTCTVTLKSIPTGGKLLNAYSLL